MRDNYDKLLDYLLEHGTSEDSLQTFRKSLKKESSFLNQRSDKFTIVLNDNELNLFKDSRNIMVKFNCCDEIAINYIAVIKHDRDYDDELKQIKTLHYHVVLQLEKVCRIGTMINKIVQIFHCNENQITIDKCNSICMQSRYLIHLDDFDKERYFENEVCVNKREVFERYINLVIIRDLHDLIGVVKQYNYDLEIIMESINNYDKWRKYINDLIINYNRKRF